MGTHPIFESDFDCLTDFVMLSRISGVTSRLAIRTSRRHPSSLGLPPKLAESYDLKPRTVAKFLFLLGSLHLFWCMKMVNLQNAMIEGRDARTLQMMKLETVDPVLGQKLIAYEMSLLEE